MKSKCDNDNYDYDKKVKNPYEDNKFKEFLWKVLGGFFMLLAGVIAVYFIGKVFSVWNF